jgi:hypothetical protein
MLQKKGCSLLLIIRHRFFSGGDFCHFLLRVWLVKSRNVYRVF